MAIHIQMRESQGVTVAEVSGRLTLGGETNQFREAMKQALAGGTKKLVLNFAKLDYIDSSGLGTLVGLASSAAGVGAQIKLAQVTGRFHELLIITKLLTVFDMYDSEAAAVASFGAAAKA